MPLSMVVRRPRPEPVYILDLDGTVLTANSFPLWALYMARAPFPGLGLAGRIKISARAILLVVARKLGFMKHEDLKWHLQALWRVATAGEGETAGFAFGRELERMVRADLQPVLAEIAGGARDGILATAAPADYAVPLGQSLGFRHVIATSATRRKTEPSTVGPYKRDAVLAFLASRGWQERPRVLFTDHEDDLPLARVCGTVHWFGRRAGALALARAHPGILVREGVAGLG